jgi:hypothetical protein
VARRDVPVRPERPHDLGGARFVHRRSCSCAGSG